MRRWLKRLVVVLGLALGLLLLAGIGGGLWLDRRIDASLPVLVGELRLAGLDQSVTIERDALGVPTIRGSSRADVARATGFLHAQERFFQMDLLRRRAAGELAELAGAALVAEDRRNRVHRFRALAERNLAEGGIEARAILETYADGVNAGLAALDAPPPEYLALRAEPRAWRAEDTTLVVLGMYLELQDGFGRRESDLGLMQELLPAELFEFLAARGTEWDAPIVGEPLATAPIPQAAVFDLRAAPAAPSASETAMGTAPAAIPGSNGWAVAGSRTMDGRALLANDMHLPLGLPNIWYRVSLVWGDERVTGVTLPGAPPVIAGSNGHVAWGFTNSQADLSDLVVLDELPDDADAYRTPDGTRQLDRFEERILVHGGDDEILVVDWTIWGPVVDRDHRGRRRAMRWIAHDTESVNLGLLPMERARDLDEALEIATRAGIPTQNVQVADRNGRVGWTLMGPLPRRRGLDGRTPQSWAGGEIGWDGHLASGEHPRVVDPANGLLWTANNRIVGGDLLAGIGDGGFALGARARQIRDDLLALDRASERDMLGVQLDDRAVFLERWRTLLLEALTPEAAASAVRRRELRRIVADDWTGRASVDSASFRMVRTFRLQVIGKAIEPLTAPCADADDRFSYFSSYQLEGPVWKLVTERPAHLLDPDFASWDDLLLASVDGVLETFPDARGPLAERTWGERNTVRVRHPLSLAVPQLARWLDLPPEPLPGAGAMPRVQSPGFGASMRIAVSPGHEDEGLFHMPGGQSGHLRSPYYREGHRAWATGEPTAFLPGPTVHTLTLAP